MAIPTAARLRLPELSPRILARYQAAPAHCSVFPGRIETLDQYMAVVSQLGTKGLWFRGHASEKWALTPGALRHARAAKREAALSLFSTFQGRAPSRLEKEPAPGDSLAWLGIAQHYGLPTRLLDWTAKPLVALYFALEHLQADGAVFMMNPVELNRIADPRTPAVLNASASRVRLQSYLSCAASVNGAGLPAVAIEPLWNCKRVEIQDGKFTLHGDRYLALTGRVLPSLVCIPILHKYKVKMKHDLTHVGGLSIISIYPELEYLCKALRDEAGV